MAEAALCADQESTNEDTEKRAKFGTRYLTDPKNVFQHNTWDNVSWDEEQETAARDIAMKHAEKAVNQEKRDEYEREAALFWDKFYGVHSNRFFKDRHWLFTEFPELYGSTFNSAEVNVRKDENCQNKDEHSVQTPQTSITSCGTESNVDLNQGESFTSNTKKDSPLPFSGQDRDSGNETQSKSFRLLEVGCGVGNTVFPVLKTNKNPNLMVYCCDFSSTAIDIVKAHPDYDQERCLAFVHDITDDQAEVPIAAGSLDVIVMIFVLSAVSPEKMQASLNHLASYLKPGGMFLFRDYGRYDMAQLRFKEGRCLSENFYVRGDGTRVYFFTQGELRSMFETAGLVEKENLIDRRLQVNRGRQLKMYRVWIQCKYIKQ